MKNTIISFLMVALTIALSSCGGGSESTDPLVGQWQAATTSTLTTLTDQYAEFNSDNTGSFFRKKNGVMRQYAFTYIHDTETGSLVYTEKSGSTVAATAEFIGDALLITTAGDKVYYVGKSIPQSVRDEAQYGKVEGEWKLSKMGQSAANLEVYLEFKSDWTCNVFQAFSSSEISVYPGTYTYVKGVLSGDYNDGATWIDDYTVAFDDECMNITLTSGTEQMTYKRTEIPSFIRNEAKTKALISPVPFL